MACRTELGPDIVEAPHYEGALSPPLLDGAEEVPGDLTALGEDALSRDARTPLANSARCLTVGRAVREALAAAARSSPLSLSMRINMELPLRAARAGPISQLRIDIT